MTDLPASFDQMRTEAIALIEANLDLPADVLITETGIVGLESTTQAQLVALTNSLVYSFERGALGIEIKRWALADLVNHGEGRYGDTYTEAIEASGLTYQTVANAAYVGRQIPYERRRPLPLTFTHHAQVASLGPAEQDYWLDQVLEHNWRTRELARAIQADRDERAGLDPEVENARRTLSRTVGGVGGLLPEHWASTIVRGLLHPLRSQGVQPKAWRGFLVALRREVNKLLKEVGK